MLELLLALTLTVDGEAAASLTDYQLAQLQRADVSDGRTKISVETNAPTPPSGTWPLRVFVDNSGGPAGPLTISFRANAQGFHTVTRTVEVRAGERRVVSIPVASEMRYGTVSASGLGVKSTDASVYFQGTYSPNKVVMALGKPEDFERFIGRPPNYSGGTVQVFSLAPNEAPSELAAYAGYDAVVVPEAGLLDGLDEGQLRGLEAYAATGGALIIQAPLRSTKSFPLLTNTTPGEHRYAFGTVYLRDLTPLPANVMRTELAVNPHGPTPEYERRYNGNHFDALLPQATAPLGRFLLIIGLFTLLIGPGSVLVARKRGPAALLVTIPLTAFVTCASIIGYSLIADGFTVHSAAYGLTWLDRHQHRAISLGVTAYYANLAPPGATYGLMTAVVPPHEDRREHFMADMAWRDGLTMGSDFIPSRIYREWGFLSVEPTRARLVVHQKGEAWVVQNALGYDLTTVSVNLDGVHYSAAAMKDGEERPLTKTTSAESAFISFSKADRFASAAVPAEALPPLGQFVARLERGGFVPTGGLKTTVHDGEQLVLGEFEP